MVYIAARAAWYEATHLGYATAGASPGPWRNDSWNPPEERRRNPLSAFFRGLRSALMGVRGTSRRQGA